MGRGKTAVDLPGLRRTEWEVARILTDASLHAATDWYVFDKQRDDAPRALDADEDIATMQKADLILMKRAMANGGRRYTKRSTNM